MTTTCLVQIAETKPLKIRVSIGHVALKNTKGPWAAPRECFFKDRPSKKLKVNTRNPEDHISAAKTYLKQIGIAGQVDLAYDPENSFETEEPDHTEIFMGGGSRAHSPEVIYTKRLAVCLGIGFYSAERSGGSLYHIPGVEDVSIKMLQEIVETETKILGSEVTVHFVSGLLATSDDILDKVNFARKKAEEIFSGHRFKRIDRTLCTNVGEFIKYFSLNTKTGIFTAKKGMATEEELSTLRKQVNEFMRSGRYFA